MSTSVTYADPAVSRLRLIALVAGLIGIVACALTPLLPVKRSETAPGSRAMAAVRRVWSSVMVP